MNMLQKMNELRKLQKQAKTIQKDLAKVHIEAEVDDLIVIINGKQEVIEVKIPEEMAGDTRKMNDSLVKAFNKALQKSQAIAAERMKDVMGDLGLGLPGM